MKNKISILSLIATIFILGAAFYFLNHHEEIDEAIAQTNNPDSYLVDATYHKMNKFGNKLVNLKAEYVQHTPHNNVTRLYNPALTLYSDEDTWFVTAQQARSENEFDKIFLTDNVTIKRIDTKAPVTAKTSTLIAQPHLYLVETDRTVTIERQGLKIVGKGLLGNLKNGDLRLLKHTKTTITPEHNT